MYSKMYIDGYRINYIVLYNLLYYIEPVITQKQGINDYHSGRHQRRKR